MTKKGVVKQEPMPKEGSHEKWCKERNLPQDTRSIPIGIVYNLMDRMHLVGDMEVKIGWRQGEISKNTCLIEPWRLGIEMRKYLEKHPTTTSAEQVLERAMQLQKDVEGAFSRKTGEYNPTSIMIVQQYVKELRSQRGRGS